ncbi:MAG: excinuclease ABC subunit UvrA [Candidatus Magnetoovum sp. WYHC-5]|nr:excinuclease ABC subunit UvrA [Candidatus Magnetoovum sp. WYHC-5]
MKQSWLEISGIKQNNLKNLSIKLPHDKVIAVTGVSGSGKSSLVFDTIFAEGQWRFIESLTSYARLFLEKLDRPELEFVKNIRPAIALEQRNPVRGARSTVGTITEIYDYLRVLYSHASVGFCATCNSEIRRWNSSAVYHELITKYTGQRAMVLFESTDEVEALKEQGFYRLYIDGEVVDVFDAGAVEAPYFVVLDRLIIKAEERLSDSIELAFRRGGSRCRVIVLDVGDFTFSDANRCDSCGSVAADATALLFSFNHPVGACPKCKGFGRILIYDRGLIVPNDSLSIAEGAIDPWEKPSNLWWKEQFILKSGIDVYKPLKDFTEPQWEILQKGGKGFYGIDEFFDELEGRRYKLHVRVFLSKYRTSEICPLCCGKRLKKEALAYRISGMDIGDLNEMPVDELIDFLNGIELMDYQREIVRETLAHLFSKLNLLKKVGLDYLTLGRLTSTLSGGEYQRANLSKQLSARLSGALYVLDEPTVGLHSKDSELIADIIKEIANQGNTILVVEHDLDIIRRSDWILELGPGGGLRGGEIIYNGAITDFAKAQTPTAKYFNKTSSNKAFFNKASKDFTKFITLRGGCGNNLKNVSVDIPVGGFSVVTGVSGSGKSTLIMQTLYPALVKHIYGTEQAIKGLPFDELSGYEHIKDVKLIDQSPIGRSPRSNPATYLKLFDQIRRIFANQPEAKLYRYEAGFFSFNVAGGRCESCKGEGFKKLEMYFFEDLYVKCDKCQGKRYNANALRVKYKGYTISDVLELTVDDAMAVFSEDRFISGKLALLKDVGLGYLRLGQSATTLSGGEAQRLKICSELNLTDRCASAPNKPKTLYIFDEPTIGLHMDDIAALMAVLKRLLALGNTIVITEHNLSCIKEADWIIDIGPGGGKGGGQILFQGTVEDLIESNDSFTAHALKKFLF